MNSKKSIGVYLLTILTFCFFNSKTGNCQLSKREAKAKFEDGFNAYLTVELEMGKYLSYCTFETEETGEFDRLGEGRFVHARNFFDTDGKLISPPVDRNRFIRRRWEQFQPNSHGQRFFLLRKSPSHRYYILGDQPPAPCTVVDNPFPKDLPPPNLDEASHDEFVQWQDDVEASGEFIFLGPLDRALFLPIVPFANRHSSLNEFSEVSAGHLSDRFFVWTDFGYDDQKNRYRGIAHFVVDGENPDTELVIELDPEQGMRPVEYMFRHILPDDSDDVNKVYIRAKTEWEQYGEFWLPKRVLLVDRSRGLDNEVTEVDKIEWWVGDDVPDEIFELKDFSKSCHEKSIIDELIAKRIKERDQAEKEKQRRRR